MGRLLRRLQLRTSLLLLGLAVGAAPAVAQVPTGTFTISAGSATITRTGSGSIPFTLTSVNGFAGQIVVGCAPPTVPAGVKIPLCGGGPFHLYTLTADQVLTDSLTLYSYGSGIPAGVVPVKSPVLAVLLVVLLLSGLTVRRRWARRLTLPLVVVALIPFSSILGCGTAPQGFTPGTYNYTVTASQYGSTTPLEQGASAVVTIR